MVFNADYVREKIKAGIASYKAGDHTSAWLSFQAALREDPQNITALLWLAYIAPNFEKRVFLLNRVLEIEPENERARKGLVWAEQQRRQETAAVSELQPFVPHQFVAADVPEERTTSTPAKKDSAPDTPAFGSDTDELRRQAQKGPIAQRVRRRFRPLLGLLLAGALLVGLAFVTLLLMEPVSLADLLPSATPTVAASPTATATATSTPPPPSPTPISTLAPPPTATSTVPPTATPLPPSPTPLPPTATPLPPARQPTPRAEKWIEVDLSTQTLVAWEGQTPVMSFLVSTGLPNTPTVVGRFHIYQKLVSTRMVGPGYDLPNVPHTMYFYSGYALHGAYWHNNFGHPMSHGCVNLALDDAEKLFNWATPVLPDGAWVVNARQDNPGTLVVVHN